MRKLRTRQHVLEELSFNFTEKQVLLASHQFIKQTDRQYSYDGTIYTFSTSTR